MRQAIEISEKHETTDPMLALKEAKIRTEDITLYMHQG